MILIHISGPWTLHIGNLKSPKKSLTTPFSVRGIPSRFLILGTSVASFRVSESFRSETHGCLGTEKSLRLSKFEKGNPGLLTHSILRSRALCNPGRFRRVVLDHHGPNIAPLGAECSRVVHRPIFSSFSVLEQVGAVFPRCRDYVISRWDLFAFLRPWLP